MGKEIQNLFIDTKKSIQDLKKNKTKIANRKAAWVNLFKAAAYQTFEQAQEAYKAAGGDSMNAGKGEYGKVDTSKKQYEAILNAGNYLPEGSENLGIEIRAAIQGGKAIGVTVITNPANQNISNLINSSVRNLTFPNNPKMDFVITRF